MRAAPTWWWSTVPKYPTTDGESDPVRPRPHPDSPGGLRRPKRIQLFNVRTAPAESTGGCLLAEKAGFNSQKEASEDDIRKTQHNPEEYCTAPAAS